jgi:hypothetical protein
MTTPQALDHRRAANSQNGRMLTRPRNQIAIGETAEVTRKAPMVSAKTAWLSLELRRTADMIWQTKQAMMDLSCR